MVELVRVGGEGAPQLERIKDSVVLRLRDAYLGPWRAVAEAPVLCELVDLALRVAPLQRALTWHRILLGVSPDERAEWQASGRRRWDMWVLPGAVRRRPTPHAPRYSMYITFFTAAIVFAASGFAERSRVFAYGIGVSAWCTRITGASRSSKHSRCT